MIRTYQFLYKWQDEWTSFQEQHVQRWQKLWNKHSLLGLHSERNHWLQTGTLHLTIRTLFQLRGSWKAQMWLSYISKSINFALVNLYLTLIYIIRGTGTHQFGKIFTCSWWLLPIKFTFNLTLKQEIIKDIKKNEGSEEFLHEYCEIIAFDPEKRTLLSLSLTRW